MSITIGGIKYDDIYYDREVDVLYLWSGAPRRPASDDASPEGHYLQFDESGSLIAITLVNARWILEREGKVVVTLPNGDRLEADHLEPLLAAA